MSVQDSLNRDDVKNQQRFWSKVKKTEGGCWEWRGTIKKRGYGEFMISPGVYRYAHRVSYALHSGSTPNALDVLHRCDNPKCVNPEHLFLGTHKDNMNDRTKKGRHMHGAGHYNASLTEEQVLVVGHFECS